MSQIIIFRLNVDGSQNDCMAMGMNGNKNLRTLVLLTRAVNVSNNKETLQTQF